MLTIKNWVRSKSALFLAATLLLAACAPPGPRALMQGQRLLEKGKYSEAIEKFKTATVLLATNAPAADAAQAWNYLGVAYQHAGQGTAAERAYLRAQALDHNLIEAHYNLGCLYLEQNRFENARGEFTTYALHRSSDPAGFIQLGTAELWAGATGAAAARAHTLTEAENTFKEALKLSPQDPQALNGIGLVRLYRGQPAEAAQYFSNAIKAQPTFAPALLNLAVVAQNYLNQPQVAMDNYRAYLALKPTPANADAVRQALRQLEQAAGQPARPAGAPTPGGVPAVTNPPRTPGGTAPKAPATGGGARSAAATSPDGSGNDNPEVVKVAEEQPVTAVDNAQAGTPASQPATASDATPTSVASVAQTNPPKRSFLQRLFGHSETASAQSASVAVTNAPTPVSNGLASEDDLPPLPTQAGARYRYKAPAKPVTGNHAEAEKEFSRGLQAQTGRHWSEAIKAYRAAIQADPSYFDAYYNLSLAAAASGELRTALAASETAVVIKPEEPKARYNFALTLRQANYRIDAANELEKLLAYSPNNSDAHLALANLYAQQLHQLPKARVHYQRVLELTPHSKQADSIRYWLVQNK